MTGAYKFCGGSFTVRKVESLDNVVILEAVPGTRVMKDDGADALRRALKEQYFAGNNVLIDGTKWAKVDYAGLAELLVGSVDAKERLVELKIMIPHEKLAASLGGDRLAEFFEVYDDEQTALQSFDPSYAR